MSPSYRRQKVMYMLGSCALFSCSSCLHKSNLKSQPYPRCCVAMPTWLRYSVLDLSSNCLSFHVYVCFKAQENKETDTRDAVSQNNSSDSRLKVISDAFVTNSGQKLNKTPLQKTKHVTFCTNRFQICGELCCTSFVHNYNFERADLC